MHEPAVTLTDYGLTLECWLFAVLIARQQATTLRRWWIVFFVATGAGSLLGGSVHGFLPDRTATLHQVVWNATLVAIGFTAVATWNLGALLTESPSVTRWMGRIAAVLLVVYIGVVVFVSNRFFVAIGMYLPATVFLTATMVTAHRRNPSRGWAIGIVGLALTYVAAAIQQIKIAPHPVYFDHNAFFHLVQAVALYLVFRAQANVARTVH